MEYFLEVIEEGIELEHEETTAIDEELSDFNDFLHGDTSGDDVFDPNNPKKPPREIDTKTPDSDHNPYFVDKTAGTCKAARVPKIASREETIEYFYHLLKTTGQVMGISDTRTDAARRRRMLVAGSAADIELGYENGPYMDENAIVEFISLKQASKFFKSETLEALDVESLEVKIDHGTEFRFELGSNQCLLKGQRKIAVRGLRLADQSTSFEVSAVIPIKGIKEHPPKITVITDEISSCQNGIDAEIEHMSGDSSYNFTIWAFKDGSGNDVSLPPNVNKTCVDGLKKTAK